MIPGPYQILFVVLIIVLLFGGKRIPLMMRSIGQSITEFKKGVQDDPDAIDDDPDAIDDDSNDRSADDNT